MPHKEESRKRGWSNYLVCKETPRAHSHSRWISGRAFPNLGPREIAKFQSWEGATETSILWSSTMQYVLHTSQGDCRMTSARGLCMIVGKELLRCDAFSFAGDLSEISYAQSLARGRAELRPGKFERCVGRILEDLSVQLPPFLPLFL